MPRFVILTHDHPTWHWDFMLEANGILRTWRLDSDPSIAGPIKATPLSDHRLIYLEYEGPVSDNRGQVRQWDRGAYEIRSESPGAFSLTLRGDKLNGEAELTTDSNGETWYEFHFKA